LAGGDINIFVPPLGAMHPCCVALSDPSTSLLDVTMTTRHDSMSCEASVTWFTDESSSLAPRSPLHHLHSSSYVQLNVEHFFSLKISFTFKLVVN